ncbi:MAG: hypothetical protein H0X11_00060 [Betaproteobacteria bacterium]|nr:hypothetical protein [Betaproteobacteria bacterium]
MWRAAADETLHIASRAPGLLPDVPVVRQRFGAVEFTIARTDGAARIMTEVALVAMTSGPSLTGTSPIGSHTVATRSWARAKNGYPQVHDQYLIDLLHGGSRITLNSGSPDLAPLRNRPILDQTALRFGDFHPRSISPI